MPNLKGWWLQAPEVVPTFPRVTKVEIVDCLKLRAASMPLFPLVEDFELREVQDEMLWKGIKKSELKTLSISLIGGLSCMGEDQIRHLLALRRLSISNCDQLETISCRGLAFMTSLEVLRMTGCYNLKLGVEVGNDDEKSEVLWGNLPRLKELKIQNVTRSCLKGLKDLTSLETLNIDNFDEELQSSEEKEGWMTMPWKSLQRLVRLELRFGGAFSMRGNQQLLKGVEYLTNSLQDLTLSYCTELYLSWTWLVRLNHLEWLEIRNVKKVISFDAPEVQQLSNTSLWILEIVGGSAEWLPDIPWKSFPFLKKLKLSYVSDLEALPEGSQHHLASLEVLWIIGCERMLSLPNWISSLSSLRQLNIWWCSEQLHKRCETLKGEDWPLIRHIERVHIRSD